MVDKVKTERLKGWILGVVNGIDVDMLENMIKNDEIPILWEYKLPSYLSYVGSLISEYKDDILKQLNFNVIMEYTNEFRPELSQILSRPDGKIWMTRFLKMIKFMVENSELTAYEMESKFNKRIIKIKNKREKEQREREQANQVALMLEKQAIETREKEKQIKEMAELKKREEQALEAQRTYEAEKRQTKTIAAIPNIETSM
ncbi:MAG TPA: hypothetical protein ENI29_21230, partial [bacterium]|nr:hypothetical protein [bacterium]